MVLPEFGIDTAPLVASAGLIGLAIGLGAQALVRDLIGGFFILVEEQYSVGDVVRIGQVTGTVERISLRASYLRDLEGALHLIPNGEVRVVANLTRGWSQAVVEVTVPNDRDVAEALDVLKRVCAEAAADPALAPLLDGAPVVTGVESLDPTGARLRILARTQPGKQWEVGRDLRRRVKLELDAASELTIPLPRKVVVSGRNRFTPIARAETAMVWVTFALCALVIIWAGSHLSRYGDIIAERTGLGGAVVGIVLLSTITSLPELAVSASSIVLVGSPDLAVGGLYGSNSFNLIIIALLDVLYRQGPLLKRVHPSHILSAGLGTAFVGTTVALVLYYQQGGVVEILGVGLGSPVFVATYLVSVTLIYRFERKRRAQVLDAAVPDTVAPGGLGGIYPGRFSWRRWSWAPASCSPPPATRSPRAPAGGAASWAASFWPWPPACPRSWCRYRPFESGRLTWRSATSWAAISSTWSSWPSATCSTRADRCWRRYRRQRRCPASPASS